jgi:hypothetical protein
VNLSLPVRSAPVNEPRFRLALLRLARALRVIERGVRDFGVNHNRQARASEALGRPGEAAADIVGGLIAGLGLPTRLRDVGVRSDQLGEIAAKSMHDRWIHTNPRKIDGPAVIRELLDAAWGVARKRRSGRLCWLDCSQFVTRTPVKVKVAFGAGRGVASGFPVSGKKRRSIVPDMLFDTVCNVIS